MLDPMTRLKLSKIQKKLLWLGVLLTFLYVGLRWFEYRHVYYPSKEFRSNGTKLNRPFQDVYFQSGDGIKLNGWFYPADTSSARQQLAVLVCHGNAGNVSYFEGLAARLLNTGVNVFAFDYRGFGHSEGRPSEEGTYGDTQAAYEWLRQRGFPATNILVYGESLGGGIASELAVREPVGGLILESTFTSITDMGLELYPWLPVRLVSSIKYDTRHKLPKIKVPVLIMHSRGDDLIPYHQAEENYAAANEPKLLYEIRGSHASADEGCRLGLEKFLATWEAVRAGGGAMTFR
jgi:uncharacterized protein